MEPNDILLIERHVRDDSTLRALYDEHRSLEKRIAKLSKKPFPTAVEEREERRLKKLKLLGKEKLLKWLERYRGRSS
jgi:uncharacterized protein YdcH (DUF465 family)